MTTLAIILHVLIVLMDAALDPLPWAHMWAYGRALWSVRRQR